MTKRFRYSLDPLLKKRQMDWSIVKVEEANAKSVVAKKENELKGIEGVIDETETLLRQSGEQGATIDRERQQSILNYLAFRHQDLNEKRKQLEQANKVHQQISRNLGTIRQGIKALEKHQSKKLGEYTDENIRREHKQLDELWLIAQGGSAALASLIKNGGDKNGS
ncbi:MAG: hypothetical protein HY308_18580 [Gammaproteobacteria bacterium]|nr:hypothetical protein [Gammaproteobacteria bacterium]